MGTWTTERVTLLRSLWADGVPGGVIAKRLGITRGMVAGKRHSLGLPPRDGEVRKAAERCNARRTAVICEVAGSRANPATVQRKAAEVEALEGLVKPLPGSNPKPWELRRWGECPYPVAAYGTPMLSCCEPVHDRRGYCLGHTEIRAGRPWPPVDPSPELAASQWEPACADG
jgi:GcrA cell cycle regulator